MKRIPTCLAALLLGAFALAAHADGLSSLEAFVKTAKSGHAEFTQVVTPPPRNGQAQRPKTSSGSFEFSRPNRFRFDYRKPFEQSIVADGETLWLYDADLNQVTARKQAAVLGSTPAALIASAADLATLKRDFELSDDGSKDGLDWVRATPRASDGQLRALRAGFKGDALAQLEIDDSFGQRSVLSFEHMALNAGVPAARFQFKPPQGAAVLRQ
ncbi:MULTISPECIES: outer membrane lipoprotein chaperone LolA [Ramlibacter]|uniref:Outer-membrane lipoprotein carrier protein n=1 Tax=Ramlibacter aquaticus TaxID=2780094 RepID=A0ABR9SAC3_9BURK|nr:MULTISPECIES: outer membrane lipoprotein chaperone LolA [Ramlibacter]MBE7939241.1 outer membrane lipoprotein chaperone LolA [Ramlibacter aquaticus]